MKRILIAAAGLIPLLGRAEVVISEVLFNEPGSDVSGEWMELYNNGGESVALSGWRIGDEETRAGTSLTEAMMFFPEGASIAPGEVQIVAANAIRFFNLYGLKATYEGVGGALGDDAEVPNLATDGEWDPDGGIINMSNSNDHVLLVSAEGVVVDRVNWGNNGGLSPGLADIEADGQSWQRMDPRVDTNGAADWALAPLEQHSTPGQVPGPRIFQAEVVVVEGAGPTLRWSPHPGALSYRVQMSVDLAEWSDEALQLGNTEWVLPTDLPARVFFRVWAD